ncbi:unnamed protein product, partial [Polarella glacialis]
PAQPWDEAPPQPRRPGLDVPVAGLVPDFGLPVIDMFEPQRPHGFPLEEQMSEDELREFVLDLVRRDGRIDGIATPEVCQAVELQAFRTFRAAPPEVDVRNSLNELLEMGEVFTTLDDDHFRAV